MCLSLLFPSTLCVFSVFQFFIRFLKIFHLLKKVKVTLVQALRLCTDRTAHRGSRGIALLFYDEGTRRGWGVSVTPRPLFTPRKDPVPIVQKAGWNPGPVWTGAENFASTGIRSPDRPACSQSLTPITLPGPLPFVSFKICGSDTHMYCVCLTMQLTLFANISSMVTKGMF